MGYPDIIILDEPTVGLDPKQIIEIRELIKKLSKKHTIILSSHILSEISAVCDYVMIINHGKLVASDTTENLEKMTLGSNTLELTVKGTKDAVESLLEGMEEIQSLEWNSKEKSEEDGTVSFTIKTEEKVDIREKLFYMMADNKMPILNMHSTKISLEDVFLELTENEKDDEKKAPEEIDEVSEEDDEGQEEEENDSNL